MYRKGLIIHTGRNFDGRSTFLVFGSFTILLLLAVFETPSYSNNNIHKPMIIVAMAPVVSRRAGWGKRAKAIPKIITEIL